MFKFSFDPRRHFNTIKHLISFFYNDGKILYTELPPDVFAEKLDINFQKSVSFYINLAQSSDLVEMDKFIEGQDLFWKLTTSEYMRSMKFLLSLGWVINDLKNQGLENPIQLLQSGNGKYIAHPGSKRSIAVGYIYPINKIKCFYVWDKKLDPNPFLLEHNYQIINNPFKFYKLFKKSNRFEIMREQVTDNSQLASYFSFVLDGLKQCHSSFSLNFITIKDSGHWVDHIKHKIFFRDIISFPEKDVCILSGIKFTKSGNDWIRE